MNSRFSVDIQNFIDENFIEIEKIYDRLEHLIQYLEEFNLLESKDRILRCVLFLAAANENLFIQYIEMAKLDYRDIIYLAEYENDKQIRDFSKPL